MCVAFVTMVKKIEYESQHDQIFCHIYVHPPTHGPLLQDVLQFQCFNVTFSEGHLYSMTCVCPTNDDQTEIRRSQIESSLKNLQFVQFSGPCARNEGYTWTVR